MDDNKKADVIPKQIQNDYGQFRKKFLCVQLTMIYVMQAFKTHLQFRVDYKYFIEIQMWKAIMIPMVMLAMTQYAIAMKIEKESTAVAVWDPQSCVQEKCPNQWAACLADPKCVPVLQDCDKKCGTSATCWTFCLSGKGDQAAIDVGKCAEANHCLGKAPVPAVSTAVAVWDPQSCIEEKCPNQWAACQADPKCLPILQECNNKCGSSATCWTFCLSGKGDQAAVDVGKCGEANHCLGSNQVAIKISPFTECMTRFCEKQIYSCKSDATCQGFLNQCKIRCLKHQSCYFDCLVEKRVFSPILNEYFTCSGEKKCI